MEKFEQPLANQKEILNEMRADLAGANSTENGGVAPAGAAPLKSVAKLSPAIVRIAVNLKNRGAITWLSKDLPEHAQAIVRRVYATKDGEVEAYRIAIEQTLAEHASPGLIEFINKYAGSPLAGIVEIEIEKFLELRAELSILKYQGATASVDESLEKVAA